MLNFKDDNPLKNSFVILQEALSTNHTHAKLRSSSDLYSYATVVADPCS